jgi:hypothetical protein
MREGGPGRATWALARAFYSSIAWYARVQKSVITRGGTGDSIIRWVRRMPARFSRGSEHRVHPFQTCGRETLGHCRAHEFILSLAR